MRVRRNGYLGYSRSLVGKTDVMGQKIQREEMYLQLNEIRCLRTLGWLQTQPCSLSVSILKSILLLEVACMRTTGVELFRHLIGRTPSRLDYDGPRPV